MVPISAFIWLMQRDHSACVLAAMRANFLDA
jgi:hypothetical protein